jgi:hypothetical protein
MALASATLSGLIRTAMLADPRIGAIDDSAKPEAEKSLTALCDAIAGAVVAHILAGAVVTIPPGVPVTTTGTAAAQAGATTAPAVGAIT